jgi:hypothetical protein
MGGHGPECPICGCDGPGKGCDCDPKLMQLVECAQTRIAKLREIIYEAEEDMRDADEFTAGELFALERLMCQVSEDDADT